MAAESRVRSLITPELLTAVADAQLPYNTAEALNFAEVTEYMTISHLAPNGQLPSLSELDLMSLLPPPESPEFPKLCFGLQLLLDQASRVLFDGIDNRWQSGVFGPLARRLAAQWLALPAEQRPDTWARWRDDVGVQSFDYWLVGRLSWIAPITHDEDLESQRIALDLMEETRSMVEERFDVKDPYRATRDALLKDDLAFLREMCKGGAPKDAGGGIDRATWIFWWCMIIDAHWPIIERFGRYPYRNAILGRQNTEEEKKWLDDTSHIAEAPAGVAKAIAADVAKGIWTPLGQGEED